MRDIYIYDPLITWSCEIMLQTKNISTTRVAIATKLGRMVTLLDGLPPTASHDLLISWSYEIM